MTDRTSSSAAQLRSSLLHDMDIDEAEIALRYVGALWQWFYLRSISEGHCVKIEA